MTQKALFNQTRSRHPTLHPTVGIKRGPKTLES
jgi:hypothetical protein